MAAMISGAISGSVGRSASASEGGSRSGGTCAEPTVSAPQPVGAPSIIPEACGLASSAMTRSARIANIGAVVVPLIAFIAAIVLLWNQIVHWYDLVAFGVMFLLTGFGVTVGFHRMLTHRSFQTSKPVEYTFAALGSMAAQGPVINWVADHRKHHAHTDEEGDPHSPHGHGDGVGGVLRGLYHAHIGWLFSEHGQARRMK